jgi:hypothetical protein
MNIQKIVTEARDWVEKWLLNIDPVSTNEIEQKMRSKMNYSWLSHYSASELRDLVVEMATSMDMAQVDKIVDDWQKQSNMEQQMREDKEVKK